MNYHCWRNQGPNANQQNHGIHPNIKIRSNIEQKSGVDGIIPAPLTFQTIHRRVQTALRRQIGGSRKSDEQWKLCRWTMTNRSVPVTPKSPNISTCQEDRWSEWIKKRSMRRDQDPEPINWRNPTLWESKRSSLLHSNHVASRVSGSSQSDPLPWSPQATTELKHTNSLVFLGQVQVDRCSEPEN